MIIRRKKFEAEIQKRVDEAICKTQDNMWQEQRQRDMYREIGELEKRLIEIEKKNGIDHPSHHTVKCW